jgi:outer membrane protein insertion porin family
LIPLLSVSAFAQEAASHTALDYGAALSTAPCALVPPETDRMQGWMVDSITVSGNKKTRDFVILREMETRPGSTLKTRILERDVRYLRGLGLFADVEILPDSLRPGGCALRVKVKERSSYFLKTILPVVNYNFGDGFSYGVRWNNRNFRGRREILYSSYIRDNNENNNLSVGWLAPWIGWKHVELAANSWYFDRSTVPESFNILEQLGGGIYLGIPLTESRISFSNAIASLAMDYRRAGSIRGDRVEQKFLSPLLGVRLDSRDSRIRPLSGNLFYLAVSTWTAVSGPRQTYYRLWNDLRMFRSLGEHQVLALRSNFNYQFGDYPEYFTVGLGGSGTLRGYPSSKYTGSHRWFQTLEWRYTALPQKVFRLPYLDYVDITVALVVFLDSGIVWQNEDAFTAKRFHGGSGFGLRLYSPFQDVVRFDLGFNAHGDVYPYLRTGIRF